MDRLLLICFVFSQNFMDHLFKAFNTAAALFHKSEFTQFIVITHNRNTVQLADVLYGVTMGKDSVSQVISLKMDQLTDEMVA